MQLPALYAMPHDQDEDHDLLLLASVAAETFSVDPDDPFIGFMYAACLFMQ